MGKDLLQRFLLKSLWPELRVCNPKVTMVTLTCEGDRAWEFTCLASRAEAALTERGRVMDFEWITMAQGQIIKQSKEKRPDRSHLTTFHFIDFCTNWRFVETLHGAGLLAPFLNSTWSLNSLNISNFLIIITFVILICDQWSFYWCLVDLRCYVSFRKVIPLYTHVHSFSYSFPL